MPVLTDVHGIPLHLVSAGANRHDAPLLAPTESTSTAAATGRPPAACSTAAGSPPSSPGRAFPAPLQVGERWVVERTHSWTNGFGKLRRCTERSGIFVAVYLVLAAVVTTRRFINEAPTRFRCDNRPTTRRLT